MAKIESTRYTAADAGPYINSALGCYVVCEVIKFAQAHGMDLKAASIDEECCSEPEALSDDYWECDVAEDWLNAHYGVPGHYWGTSEMGDWGLWPNDEDY